MGWADLMTGAAEAVTAAFGQLAVTDDWRRCRVILDVIPQTTGSILEPIVMPHPVLICLRLELPEGLSAGSLITLEQDGRYRVEGLAEERTDRHHLAYWARKIDLAINILSARGAHFFEYTTVTGNLPIKAGSLQLIGDTPMIPLENATVAGQVMTCQVGGAVLLPKRVATTASGGAWKAGDRVYLYTVTGEPNQVTGLAAVGRMLGYGLETTATGESTAAVRLIGNAILREDQDE